MAVLRGRDRGPVPAVDSRDARERVRRGRAARVAAAAAALRVRAGGGGPAPRRARRAAARPRPLEGGARRPTAEGLRHLSVTAQQN